MWKINKTGKIPNSIELPNTIELLEVDKLIIKPLDLHELLIALKRLTKFKYPHSRKYRVYREIIVKNTIFPKISLKNIHTYPLGVIDALVQIIWNQSVQTYTDYLENDYFINIYLGYEEIKAYSCKEMIRDLICSENIFKSFNPGCMTSINMLIETQQNDLENQLAYILNENAFNLALPNCFYSGFDSLEKIYLAYQTNFPLNISSLLSHIDKLPDNKEIKLIPGIKRLLWLNSFIKAHKYEINNEDISKNLQFCYKEAENYRKAESAKFPEKLLILVEGATEEKLLPIFSIKKGIDFNKLGVQVIAAGGKNQVEKIYREYSHKLNSPILVILDADAEKIGVEIKSFLLKKDFIYILPEGEFEDILDKDLIIKSVNKFYRLTAQVYMEEIISSSPTTEVLTNLWKNKGLGEFDKVEFAQIISENIVDVNDISPTLNKIIQIISDMLKI